MHVTTNTLTHTMHAHIFLRSSNMHHRRCCTERNGLDHEDHDGEDPRQKRGGPAEESAAAANQSARKGRCLPRQPVGEAVATAGREGANAGPVVRRTVGV